MTESIRFERRMNPADALFWRMEDDPVLRSTTSAITLLTHAPDRELLREKLRRASIAIPRLRQHVERSILEFNTPVWEQDPYFDLDYHIRWIRAAGDGSLDSILELASVMAMQGFDRSRPLWEFTVVEGLADGGAAIIQKLHHAVTDGVAGLELMRRVYDRVPEMELPECDPYSAPRPEEASWSSVWSLASNITRAVDQIHWAARGLTGAVRRPIHAFNHLVRDLRSVAHVFTPVTTPLSPIMRKRSSGYRFQVISVPTADLKAAAHAANCKLNDAYLAAISAGWRLYHEHHGAEVDELRMTLPINARVSRAPQAAGNQLQIARLPLPIGIRDPRERMKLIHQRVRQETSERGMTYTETVLGALNALPTPALTVAFGRMLKGIDFIASCVPGVSVPLYVAGAPVRNLFAFGPTGGTAANFTLFSYGDRCEITLNADPAAIPDYALLASCVQKGFEEVLA